MSAEREELVKLRRENKQLKLEREVLSKAMAWFAREADTKSKKSSGSEGRGLARRLPPEVSDTTCIPTCVLRAPRSRTPQTVRRAGELRRYVTNTSQRRSTEG